MGMKNHLKIQNFEQILPKYWIFVKSVMGIKEYKVGRKWKKKKKNHEHFSKNFENGQNTTFSTPKMAKTRMPILQKVSIFMSIFALRALFMALLYWKII